MTRRSANTAQLFGLFLIVLISAWDMDAMRIHIATHSWATLAFVSLYLIVHLSDYLTVGRLIHRFDPLAFTNSNQLATIPVLHDATQTSGRPAKTAELYTFKVVTSSVAQASGSPYTVTRQHIVIQPE